LALFTVNVLGGPAGTATTPGLTTTLPGGRKWLVDAHTRAVRPIGVLKGVGSSNFWMQS